MKNTSEHPKGSAFQSGAYRRLKIFSELMDNRFAIPGTSVRIGLDGLLGLIPGIGDAASAIVSVYIITEAYLLGVSWLTLWKMSGNVALDFIIGLLPIFGDAADVFFKANQRNLALLKKELNL